MPMRKPTEVTSIAIDSAASAVWKLRNPKQPWATAPDYWKRRYRQSARVSLKAALPYLSYTLPKGAK